MKHLTTGPTQAGGGTTPDLSAPRATPLPGAGLQTPPGPGPALPAPAAAEAFRIESAARIKPLEAVRSRPPLSEMVKEGATEAALNAAGAVRDAWADLQSADRWFKYKVGIVAGWVLLAAAGFYLAYPRDPGPKNTIGARLVKSKVVDTPVFMIVNDSGRPWENVVIEVNYAHRASFPRVGAEQPENSITVEAQKGDLQVVQLHVRTSDGNAELI